MLGFKKALAAIIGVTLGAGIALLCNRLGRKKKDRGTEHGE